jgi:thiamine biosynthesis lipoprotein
VLAQSGIRSALVAASGDLAIGEPPPGQRGWKIGVSRGGSEGGLERILVLHNAAVSTSGDAEQNLEIEGKRYSHIVDPSTNMGLTTPITVTIVARKGIDADSLATAVSVLGADRGLSVIRKYPDAAALIITGAGAAARAVESPDWNRLSHEDR